MARTPPLVTLPGEAEYGKYLDRLIEEAQKHGHPVKTRTGIVELCLNMVRAQWGLDAPRRAKPFGANQYPSGPQPEIRKNPPTGTRKDGTDGFASQDR